MGRARQHAPNELAHGRPPRFNLNAAEHGRNSPKRRRRPRFPRVSFGPLGTKGRFGRGVPTRDRFRQREPGSPTDHRGRQAHSAPADPILSFTRAGCLPRSCPLVGRRRRTFWGGGSAIVWEPTMYHNNKILSVSVSVYISRRGQNGEERIFGRHFLRPW